MNATNSVNQEITLQEAIALTARFQQNRPDNYPVSEAFDIASVNNLISAAGCQFLRVYLGMKDDQTVVVVLVAADADGNDILPPSENNFAETDDNPVILEDGYRCPQDCPTGSPLMGN